MGESSLLPAPTKTLKMRGSTPANVQAAETEPDCSQPRMADVDPRGGQEPALLGVGEVARMLSCSPRTIYRLADSGRMPRPMRLGTLVRWSREALEQWIADGCPPCDKPLGRR